MSENIQHMLRVHHKCLYGQRHKKELQFGNNPLALKLNGHVPGEDSRRAAEVL